MFARFYLLSSSPVLGLRSRYTAGPTTGRIDRMGSSLSLSAIHHQGGQRSEDGQQLVTESHPSPGGSEDGQ